MLSIPNARALDCIPVGRLAIDINPADMTQSFAECLHFKKYVGGSPANTAVGLAKLGARAGFIGKVSDDSLGDFAVDYIRNLGVDVRCVSRADKEVPIGLAFTETRDHKTNLMMYRTAQTADLQLCCDDIDEDYIASSRSIVISGTALSASPSRDACFKALELAKKHGLLIVFDIDYRAQVWENPQQISVYYTLAANYAHVIMGSREEFDLMDGIAGETGDDARTAARWFSRNAQIVIIKHGADGSNVFVKDGSAYQVDIVAVNMLKSTGGGDAYSSAFLYGLLHDLPVKRCLELATASASLAVAAPCCSDAMVDLATLEEVCARAKAEVGELVHPL